MRLVTLSDTHNRLSEVVVPDGDILIHCGDATLYGSVEELVRFNAELRQLRARFHHILFVPGNHDVLFQTDFGLAASIVGAAKVLHKDYFVIRGISFYGCASVPVINHNWAFEESAISLRDIWKKMPDEIDVLITHGPPYLILDKTYRSSHVGDVALRDRIQEIKPKVHVFGHIHESYGVLETDDTLYVNTSIMNRDYKIAYRPIVVDVTDSKQVSIHLPPYKFRAKPVRADWTY